MPRSQKAPALVKSIVRMAGTDVQLLTRLSCRLHIERDGTSLLDSACSKARFSISLHSAAASITLRLTPKLESLRLPTSPLFPRQFDIKLVKKVSARLISEGKLTLSLLNYNSDFPNCTMYRNPPSLTHLFLSEAEPEAVKELQDYLCGKPVKRSLQEEAPMEKRVKRDTLLEKLPSDVMAIVYAMTGEPLKKFRLINRWFRKSVCYHVSKVKVLDAAMASGPMVSRLIKRTTALKELDLENCRDFTYTTIHTTKCYPFRRLLKLSLQDCKGINSAATLMLIKQAPDLLSLNLLGCSNLDDKLLSSLSPRLDLKHLTELSMSNLSAKPLASFLRLYNCLESLRLKDVVITGELVGSLLDNSRLSSLCIEYRDVEKVYAEPVWPAKPLHTLSILPMDRFIRPSQALIPVWQCLQCQRPRDLGTDVKSEELPKALLEEVVKITCVGVMEGCATLREAVLYTDGYELLEKLEEDGPEFLSTLERLTVVLNSDWQKTSLAAALATRFPALPVTFRLVNLR